MADKKIKILFLDHTPFIGGAQLSLIEHLKKINTDIFYPIVVCSKNAENIGLTEIYKKNNIKYYYISFGQLKIYNPIAIFRLFKSVRELNGLINNENPDLIFSNTIRANIIGSLSAFFKNKKIIWFIQDYTFPKILFKLFYFIPKKIYFVSESVAAYYNVKLNKKNVVLYIWRDMVEAIKKVSIDDIENNRKSLGNGNKLLIGYIGRLVDWKGPQVLIKAAEIFFKKQLFNFQILIIGDGKGQKESNEADLKEYVLKNNINNVSFLGFKNNIPLFMKSLDIFCLTSVEPEPYSSVVVEAMMAKVPVIGTNLGGTPEIVRPGETGLLVEPNNPEDLVNAILKLATDKKLAENISENAYNYVVANNTAEIKTRFLEKEYLNISGDKNI